MNTSIIDTELRQEPAPGRRLLMTRGDTITFALSLASPAAGKAWIRTNIGHGEIQRREIVRKVEYGEAPLAKDWFDRPMTQVDAGRFRITLPLIEVGHFEAKCFFLPEGQNIPTWPAGGNTVVNVEPADTCAGNIIYNAFVRQFGPNRSGSAEVQWQTLEPAPFDDAGFTVIPPSGKFRDLIRELDFIVHDLGCTFLQLLPIHPTPTTYARMGRFGSPYAALSFTEVDPALAEFDPAATPLEQFLELVDAVHTRGARLILDIAINHTGWAARLHGEHPEWLVRDPDGTIEVPGAWGVAWEDLTRLDYNRRDLWIYMAQVFLTWCRRGVDGFRCDAGYMIPEAAWTYITARVRSEFPDTLFFLEGLGGKISVTRRLLDRANLNWAYSELFQNYDRAQIEGYLPGAYDIAETDGITVHFAETHDNLRLAARSRTWARLRTRLCALLSPRGAFAFANGVEWFATEKIVVHQSPSLNWGASDNQVADIARLSAILKTHPAFWDQTDLELIESGEGNMLVLLRHHRPTGKRLLIAANLDDATPTVAGWDPDRSGIISVRLFDLMSSRELQPDGDARRATLSLAPGEVLCLSPDRDDLDRLTPTSHMGVPARNLRQRLRAMAMEIASASGRQPDADASDWDRLAEELVRYPAAFGRRFNPDSEESRVVNWQWPRDTRREVMVPPGHRLIVSAPHPFRARLTAGQRILQAEASLPGPDDMHFSLFKPLGAFSTPASAALDMTVFEPDQPRHDSTPIRFLPDPLAIRARQLFTREDIESADLLFLGTNGRGGMCRASARWGELRSRYDALLAANISPDYPEDRRIMLTRIRGWAVYQGYSQALRPDCTEAFEVLSEKAARWRFRIPTGQGESVRLTVRLSMANAENTVRMTFGREFSASADSLLGDDRPVELILRPDIEDRRFHDTTKAFTGSETQFPAAVSVEDGGFLFSPHPPVALAVSATSGRFVREPEWQYMVHRPYEAERGLDPESDLFSPGFFRVPLLGGENVTITAYAADASRSETPSPASEPPEAFLESPNPEAALAAAMDAYVVRRGAFATVIAGYPWFLDWGRDTLIFVRGLIAAGRTEAARAIIRQFAAFEAQGTLPNMIRGTDAGNRDTSDAPLWLAVAAADLAAVGGTKDDLLRMDCGGRPLGRVLTEMARSLVAGTPNGIHMDPDSGLLYSPSHFTWMDTNHPAGTPRQGYPVEIAAMWFATLRFLSEIGGAGDREHWRLLADQVRRSIRRLFYRKDLGYLSDCLHAEPGCPADRAEPDDALRPNQLLAVTLGALGEPDVCQRLLHACEELLVPGAIRSLADRPLRRALEIRHEDQLLVDPGAPYQGRYAGEENTRRKPAYHNGTAWTWMFPSFCEAWAIAYGRPGATTALAWLSSGIPLLNTGCIGHLPEILDGDRPHTPRGCDAQAWGVSEYYRVWRFLRTRLDSEG